MSTLDGKEAKEHLRNHSVSKSTNSLLFLELSIKSIKQSHLILFNRHAESEALWVERTSKTHVGKDCSASSLIVSYSKVQNTQAIVVLLWIVSGRK